MLKLDLKKEIGELGALVIALIIGFVASSFWIGLISFVVLELVYLLVYDAIAKKAEAREADLVGDVDLVLTFDELKSIYD